MNCLSKKYILYEVIGKGAFGEVYKVARISDGLEMAMKIEQKLANSTRLIPEYKIYQKLVKRKCRQYIPHIYELIQTNDYNIMTMELLGNSLEEIFTNHDRIFRIDTVLYIGVNILKIIKSVHDAGFIHRDIKPNNFLVGYTNRQKIYLTDFGLSKEYINKHGLHMRETFEHDIIGTARYSSINMHLGFEPSRRDDLEAICYMLIYFAKGVLPWQNKAKTTEKKNIFETIGNIKLTVSVEELCDGLPICFMDYLKYCRKLKFAERPDYTYIENLFIDTIKQNNFNCAYEWL